MKTIHVSTISAVSTKHCKPSRNPSIKNNFSYHAGQTANHEVLRNKSNKFDYLIDRLVCRTPDRPVQRDQTSPLDPSAC